MAQELPGAYRAVAPSKYAMDAPDWGGGADHVVSTHIFTLGSELGAAEEHVGRRSRVGAWAGIKPRANRI